MDLAKETLQYVVGLEKPEFIEGQDGYNYANRQFFRIEDDISFPRIKMRTLQSLKDYLEHNPDGIKGNIICIVKDPEMVELYSDCGNKRMERLYIAELDPQVPDIAMGSYLEREKFIINLQSCFLPYSDENGCDLADVIALCSNIKIGTVQAYEDNGCYQKCTVRDGIVDEKEVAVPSVVMLQPFSTFPEVEQPVRKFLFRLKNDKYSESGSSCALFEADGGAWKNQATQNVAEWIKANITPDEMIRLTVLY